MKKRPLAALMPLYLWTTLLVLLPMLYVLFLSFMSQGEGVSVDYVFTLANYKALLDEGNISIFLRSLRIAVATTALTLLIGYPFAYAMTTRTKRQQRLLMLLIVVPFWTSALLRMYGWILILRTNGLLNSVIRALGFSPLKMLYNEGATLFGMVYTFLPFMVLPIYTSLEKQDRSLRDAARDLGANPIRAFVSVVLPLTLPGVASGAAMVLVPSVGMFFIADLMGGGTEMLLGNLINHYLHSGRNWPLGAALSMVMVVMTYLTIQVSRRFAGGDQLGVF